MALLLTETKGTGIIMKYTLAVFDLDGTILDTLDDLADSLNHVLALHGYPQKTREEVRAMVGNGIRRLIERALPQGEDLAAESVYQEFLSYYQKHCADRTRPYEGIVRLLGTLRAAGCMTAVVSNKADVAVQELCRRYFDGLFDLAMGARDDIPKKPAPDTVYSVLEKLGVPREKAVYIGDSEVDIATAANAGMDSIIVTWGFREKVFLRERGANILADEPSQLEALILH